MNPLTYKNREKVFEECVFKNIRLQYYTRFVAIMNKNVSILKTYDYIHPSTDVKSNLIKQLDTPVTVKNLPDSLPLNAIRHEVMNQYFREKLEMTETQISKARGTYVRLKHRSLSSIVNVLNVLKNDLNFSNERIIKNSFLIHACGDNIRSILKEIPKIGDTDIKQIIYDRPKILMQSSDALKTIIRHIKKFDINEDSIERCVDVLTLGPDTVYTRLSELSQIKDFQVHFSHPRFLRLIHYQNKVIQRLDYLKSLKIRCYSIHLLSASAEQFEKFTYDGMDKTKGMDTLELLSHIFKIDSIEIRSQLKLHPNWLQAPLIEIKNTFDYLRQRNFTNEEIYENIIILLYPIPRLQSKLNELIEWKEENDENRKISDVEVRKLSNSKLISLCLYFIEIEYHFTGDGIFEVQKLDKHQDPVITISELPKINLSYRYGEKSQRKVKINE